MKHRADLDQCHTSRVKALLMDGILSKNWETVVMARTLEFSCTIDEMLGYSSIRNWKTVPCFDQKKLVVIGSGAWDRTSGMEDTLSDSVMDWINVLAANFQGIILVVEFSWFCNRTPMRFCYIYRWYMAKLTLWGSNIS